MKTFLPLAVVVAVVAHSAQAQYVSNFDGLSPNTTLSAQDGWDTNDTAQSDFVGVVPGYSTSLSDYWAVHGGLVSSPEPSSVNTLLWRSFNPIPNTTTTTFSVKMAISSSVTPRTNQDTFGWILSDSSANEIVELRFVPSGGNLTINYVDHTAGGSPVYSGWEMFYDSQYTISATLSNLSTTPVFQVTLTDAFNTSYLVVNTALSSSAADVGRVSSSWTLASTTSNFGSNSMIFDQLSVVPEPGAVALTLVGLAGLAALRLRRKRCD